MISLRKSALYLAQYYRLSAMSFLKFNIGLVQLKREL